MGRITDFANRPCLSALNLTRALPAGVRGPVERCALRRLASNCFGLVPDIIVPFCYKRGGAIFYSEVMGNLQGHGAGKMWGKWSSG